MSERSFLFLTGFYILCALYFEIDIMIYVLSAVLLFEGVTDWRMTTMLQKVRNQTLDSGLLAFQNKARFNIDGLRAWRVVVAIILLTVYLLLHQYEVEYLWFFPWFMGFAILGAGASSLCPVLIFLRWAGFR